MTSTFAGMIMTARRTLRARIADTWRHAQRMAIALSGEGSGLDSARRMARWSRSPSSSLGVRLVALYQLRIM